MEIVEQIKRILGEHFGGCDPKIEWDEDLQKVVGVVLWQDFEKLDHATRQRKLWSVLRHDLGADAQRVSLLLTFTPKEYETQLAAGIDV